MQIPTPEEVDYYKTAEISKIVEIIVSKMKIGVFSFKPEYGWEQHLSTIQKQFSPDWNIKTSWSGGREDGHQTWALTPNKTHQ